MVGDEWVHKKELLKELEIGNNTFYSILAMIKKLDNANEYIKVRSLKKIYYHKVLWNEFNEKYQTEKYLKGA